MMGMNCPLGPQGSSEGEWGAGLKSPGQGTPLLCFGELAAHHHTKQATVCLHEFFWEKTVNMITIALNQAQNFKYKSQEVVHTFIMG